LADSGIRINHQLKIPERELDFQFTRSGGPGGQHVNRSATRVELFFDVAHSPSLTDRQRKVLLRRLDNDIDSEGKLRIVSQGTPSQWRNRCEAVDRFKTMLAAALKPRRRRIRTHPSRAQKERRLERKRRRSRKKRLRKRVRPEDYQ
jgi:ribosome-associated protein